MEKIKLNKTQIGYFEDRVNAIQKIKIREIDEGKYLPKVEGLSREDKLGQIVLGSAVLKSDITPDGCIYNRLLDSFDYAGEDVIDAKQLQYAERYNKIVSDIGNYAQKLKDGFVLNRFETTLGVEMALEEFENKDFAEPYLK